MEMKESLKMQAERTIEHMLYHVDEVLDSADENGGYLSDSDVHCLQSAWKTICSAKEIMLKAV